MRRESGDGVEEGGREQSGEAEEFDGFEASNEAVDDQSYDVGVVVDLFGAVDGIGGDVGT